MTHRFFNVIRWANILTGIAVIILWVQPYPLAMGFSLITFGCVVVPLLEEFWTGKPL